MYFSLVMPKQGQERGAAHEWARGPYSEHQWLWNLFPASRGTERDFLFRRCDAEGIPSYYVVSKRFPQRQIDFWEIKTSEYDPKLSTGMRLRFDLRANPIVTHSGTGKSARHDVVMQEKKRLLQERSLSRWQDWKDDDKPPLYMLVQQSCGAWLRSRATRLGFEIDEDCLAVDGYQQHVEKDGQLRFSTVDFSGELKVIDPVAFMAALHEGVGRAKAFGCGLLLVRRT